MKFVLKFVLLITSLKVNRAIRIYFYLSLKTLT